MAYETERSFMNNPHDFIANNILYPIFSFDTNSGVYGVKFKPADPAMYGASKRGKYKDKSAEVPRYNVAIDANSPLRMYYLKYQGNAAHGMALGIGANSPRLMITARMNSCTFGHNQLNGNNPAFVSHHNAQKDNNVASVMEGQPIQWLDDAGPGGGDYQFSHRTDYMKYIGKEKGKNYGATLLGIRDGSKMWHFYYQITKGHGGKHKNLSLKGVKEVV